jgi:hypothetical protein
VHRDWIQRHCLWIDSRSTLGRFGVYRTICRAIPAVLLVVFLAGVPAGTQTPRTAAPKLDDQAMAILKRMADFLA